MTTPLDLVVSLAALAGMFWAVRRIATGRASRTLFTTVTVGLFCGLVLLYEVLATAPRP